MKTLVSTLAALCLGLVAEAQVSGNINYMGSNAIPDNYITVTPSNDRNLHINIKGMINAKPDVLIATFSVRQTGKSVQDVQERIDQRIQHATKAVLALTGTEVYVDMISCVPVYQTQTESRIFSKKTYNEVPAGFEIRKNIQIRLTNPRLMDQLMLIMAQEEIYDLVKADYTVLNMEKLKKELMDKAQKLALEKVKFQETLLGISLAGLERSVNDGFKVYLPTELYKRYTAYNSSRLPGMDMNRFYTADKNTSLYYQAITDKEFDFVLNPGILEPTIQILYQVQLTIFRDAKEKATNKPQKEYLLISPSGEIKQLPVKP